MNETGPSSFKTVNSFRKKRGAILSKHINKIAEKKGKPIEILDIGGRSTYWENLDIKNVARIIVLNSEPTELDLVSNADIFESKLGDARNLSDYESESVDLVHSNSVIEHVGSWESMQAMAHEMLRVGRSGWMQTPAWEFPLEPHFRAPLLHWFGQPIRRKMLFLSKYYRNKTLTEKRYHIDRINLLSKSEVKDLFGRGDILVERFLLLPKSYIVRW